MKCLGDKLQVVYSVNVITQCGNLNLMNLTWLSLAKNSCRRLKRIFFFAPCILIFTQFIHQQMQIY